MNVFFNSFHRLTREVHHAVWDYLVVLVQESLTDVHLAPMKLCRNSAMVFCYNFLSSPIGSKVITIDEYYAGRISYSSSCLSYQRLARLQNFILGLYYFYLNFVLLY